MPATHRAPISSSPAENPRPCQIRPCARPVGKVCWKRFRQTLAHLWHRARKQPWQPERSHPPALSPTTRAPQLSRHPLAFTCLRGPAGPERTKRVEHAPTCGHRLNNALGESERDLTAANGLWIGRLDPALAPIAAPGRSVFSRRRSPSRHCCRSAACRPTSFLPPSRRLSFGRGQGRVCPPTSGDLAKVKLGGVRPSESIEQRLLLPGRARKLEPAAWPANVRRHASHLHE
jgi:hypothetical protein